MMWVKNYGLIINFFDVQQNQINLEKLDISKLALKNKAAANGVTVMTNGVCIYVRVCVCVCMCV